MTDDCKAVLPSLVGDGPRIPPQVTREPPSGFVGPEVLSIHDNEFEVLLAAWDRPKPPAAGHVNRLHAWRAGSKAVTLVVAVRDQSGQIWVRGPREADGLVGPMGEDEATRMLQAALGEHNALLAAKRIGELLAAKHGTEAVLGLRDEGFFTRHFLLNVLPSDPAWHGASREAELLDVSVSGTELLQALGYELQPKGEDRYLLRGRSEGEPDIRAVAVLLKRDESFEQRTQRFRQSPAVHGIAFARKHDVKWVIVLRGSQIRLYSTDPGVGVGSRGQVDTFFELDLALLNREHLPYLRLVFSVASLARDGQLRDLLDDARRYAVRVGDRLRDRVYFEVVPDLAVAVAQELDRLGRGGDLKHAYRVTLRILFRWLFQAYAEDRGLLPYGRNSDFDSRSLKRLAEKFLEHPPEFDDGSFALWDNMKSVWRIIDAGSAKHDVPAYNGGLFGQQLDVDPEGHLITQMDLSDAVVGRALVRLLLDKTEHGELAAVDYRSLSIREFGTIYEGLLESSLSRATLPLTVDKNDAYVPAKAGDDILVAEGDIYFHNASGLRKSTGTYFTPSFAVQHLLDRTLAPALASHLERITERLEAGDESGAYEAFFDFRVADLAMGSGNFLIAAVDQIEVAFTTYLAQHPIRGVVAELDRLFDVAKEALGELAGEYDLDFPQLLRRQIARHCIYGIDVNDLGVELARVAVWLHTFVPGLPMSALDYNLVCADSLVGLESVEEAVGILDNLDKSGTSTFWLATVVSSLNDAAGRLREAATVLEADKAEVEQVRALRQEAEAAAAPARAIFDVAMLYRIGEISELHVTDVAEVTEIASRENVRRRIVALNPGHMPYLFPQVFLRERPGFDVLLGNPPWEEVTIEELGFWTQYSPGLKGMAQAQQQATIASLKSDRPDLVADFDEENVRKAYLRKILTGGQFPGMGSGDPDLYKAFAWRYARLLRPDGYIGMVLPVTAIKGKGTGVWREYLFRNFTSLMFTVLENAKGWVFPNVEFRYRLTLLSANSGAFETSKIQLCGPYRDMAELKAGLTTELISMTLAELRRFSDDLVVPFVESADAMRVFRKMATHPSFGSRQEVATQAASSQQPAASSQQPAASSQQPALLGVYHSGWLGRWQNCTRRTRSIFSCSKPINLGCATSSRGRCHPGQGQIQHDSRGQLLARVQGEFIRDLDARHGRVLRLL